MNRIRAVFRDSGGATSIEYAVIASLISVVAVTGFSSIGAAVSALFSTVPSF